MVNQAINDGSSPFQLVWRQVCSRRIVVFAMILIYALTMIAIWAPFLANDRPIYYYGINRFQYQEALRNINAMLTQLSKLAVDHSVLADHRESSAHINHKDSNHKDSSLSYQRAILKRRILDSLSRLGNFVQQDEFTKLGKLTRELENSEISADHLRGWIERFRATLTAKTKLIPRGYFPVLEQITVLNIALILLSLVVTVLLLLRIVLGRAGVWHVKMISRTSSSKYVYVSCLGFVMIFLLSLYLTRATYLDRTPYKRGVLMDNPHASTAPVVYEAVLWPLIPYSYDENNINRILLPPAIMSALVNPRNFLASSSSPSLPWDASHWLGTDELGRDVLTRLIWGSRISLSVGLIAVSIYVAIGIIIGAVAGYFRGWYDFIISRLIEIVICFPSFFLILAIVAFVGPGIMNIMIIIGLTSWTGIARLIRAEFLKLVQLEYVLAARALGCSWWRIIFRHILPNALAPVSVAASFGIAGAILTESSLSFLGLGVTPPDASWGTMLQSGREAIFRAPWLIIFPGLAIFLTITCYNLVGEALRDATDPRLRGKVAHIDDK